MGLLGSREVLGVNQSEAKFLLSCLVVGRPRKVCVECISAGKSIFVDVCLSVLCLSSVRLFVPFSVCPSNCLTSVCVSIYLSVCVYVRLSICLQICLFMRPSLRLFAHLMLCFD